MLETVGDAKLQRWRRREGDELMRLADDVDKCLRSRHPADLPSRERKHLSSRTDAHAALAHSGQAYERGARLAVEHQMFIDLVADDKGVAVPHHTGEQRNFLR